MRKITLLSLPLTMIVIPSAFAQDEGIAAPPPAYEAQVPSPELQAQTVAGWPPERQAQYEMWAEDHRTFFWTLPPTRQDIFWRIAPDDRSRLIALTSEEQEVIWTGMEAQIAAEGQPDAVPPGEPMTGDGDMEEAPDMADPAPEPMHEDDLTQPRG